MENKYIMKCDCILTREELVVRHRGLKCKNHPKSGIDYLEKSCSRCGKAIKCTPNQTTRKFCVECAVIAKRELKKENYKRRCEKRRKHRASQFKDEYKFDVERYTRGWEYYLKHAA